MSISRGSSQLNERVSVPRTSIVKFCGGPTIAAEEEKGTSTKRSIVVGGRDQQRKGRKVSLIGIYILYVHDVNTVCGKGS